MAQDAAIVLKKLAERVLAKNGDVPLAQLLELLVPVRRLRDLARDLGLTPKGGFRVDKAPAHVLAPLLADVREPEPLDRILRALLPAAAGDAGDAEPAPAVDPAVLAEVRQLLSLRDSEVVRLRDDVERAREALARAQEREREHGRRAERLEQELSVLRRDRGSRAEPVREAPSRDDKELLRRLHDLENEREGFVAADAALRRQAAFDLSRLRDLEQAVRELEELLPKGKRRRKPPPPEPPPPPRRFLLPRFTAAFYKSLDGKEPRAVERAIQAVLLFCTEGHGYPGLEVKQLGGQDTWSLRASLGLRVYFRQGDGEIELLELGDREDQHTTLRRLKER